MQTTFLITGASGNVGTALLEHLPSNDRQQVYKATWQSNTRGKMERWLDFEQPDSFEPALQGIEVVFLLRPPKLADVKAYFIPFINACQRASIKHIVFLSVQGADKLAFIPHAKLEKLIRQSGISYTFIRPSYFMQNLTTTLKDDIVRHHRLFLPAGQAPFLWVDVSDIGRAIAVVLENWTQHQYKIYTITGTERLSFKQVCSLLTIHLGFTVVYVSSNLLRFYLAKRREGVASRFILVMILLHYLPRFQKPPYISPDFTYLTGRQPNKLAQFINQHKTEWT
ncbi:NmrA family NAD(P)-binding protein [Spirosoma sp. SC4-14]|uniref:NmrA family NAD(P)-binding protein n=1 Tax=Spirosoma sp. SC4-14 TaxID=3128900 RepID=UPI0030D12F31